MTEKIAAVRHFRLGVVAGVVALVLFAGTALVGSYLRQDSIQNTCEAVNGNRAILRGILLRSEQLTLRHYEPGSGFSKGQIIAYYERSIDDLAPASC